MALFVEKKATVKFGKAGELSVFSDDTERGPFRIFLKKYAEQPGQTDMVFEIQMSDNDLQDVRKAIDHVMYLHNPMQHANGFLHRKGE